jgi:GxxExxY protein
VLKHSDVTSQIVNAFYHVYNQLGQGFLEKVYENSLAIELRKRNLDVQQQAAIEVRFDGEVVGDYYADLLIAGCVIVEIKAADTLNDANVAQLLNYLKATQIDVGLLLNFGPKPQVQRKVFETARPRYLSA